jgi:nucleotide-binding universal stress UspA family protein
MLRYLTPVVSSADASAHLEAACQLVARDGGQLVALVIGLVPSSLPIGADTPVRWSRLDYEAARVRRFARAHGVDVETVLALSDSAGAAVVALAEELGATAICLAYQPGWRAALRRWRDAVWQTVLDQAPCPVVLERPLPREREIRSKPSPGPVPLCSPHHGEAG